MQSAYPNKLKLFQIINQLKKKKQIALVFSILIFLSFQPWFVWSLDNWNMRLISLATFALSIQIITAKSIKENLPIALLYVLARLIMCFGGLKGIILPTHLELSIFVFILAFSRKFLIMTLRKFETLIAIVLTLGILTYFLGLFIDLPNFSIEPLNKLKTSDYNVYFFELKTNDYAFSGFRRFMSVFDEPGVIGSMLALLISYKKMEHPRYKDYVFLIAGLLSFSLVFYIVLIINAIYSKILNLKILIVVSSLLAVFFYSKPQFFKEALLDRIITDKTIEIKDNRSTEFFLDKYDQFIHVGGLPLFIGLGPENFEKLGKEGVLNVSSYKTLVYMWGFGGLIVFIFFFFYSTMYMANSKRAWFFFVVFLMVGWQRPGVFNYGNLFLFLSCLSFISLSEVKNKIRLSNSFYLNKIKI